MNINVDVLYSSLKDTYYFLKKKYFLLKESNNKLLLELEEANNKIKELELKLEEKDENMITISSNNSHKYVSYKKYIKQVKLTKSFIDLYHKEKDKNSGKV